MRDELKYVFFICSALLLALMLLLSRNAGVSCDEVLHYDHSVDVYNYFTTRGADRSALETPVTHLKYYGQSYDNIVTFIIKWTGIEDVYRFRHLMSSLAGWLTIIVTAMFGVMLSGYRTGILVIILFALSPTFMGHAQNNLKDVPFALSYIAAILYIIRTLHLPGGKIRLCDTLLLILSIGFSISVRAGGLLLICYLVLFFIFFVLNEWIKERKINYRESGIKLAIIILVSVSAFILGILLWPFALEDPLRNVIASYRVMANFPDTFRQLFEGRTEWSDYMPWYYLPKSMAITIPFIIIAGALLFTVFTARIIKSGKATVYGCVIFSILFPVLIAVVTGPNIYSSWRQFLFVYPSIVLVAAAGFDFLFEKLRKKRTIVLVTALMFLLAVHPLRYMLANPSFYYIYYNQFTGGLKGAYGNYETDYYYVSQTKASEWLIGYLNRNEIDSALVKATYSVVWHFRNYPAVKTSYLRYEERSQHDWDFVIAANRYIPPYQLRNKIWPPGNTIHIIEADGVPVCAVLERRSKNDYYGYLALSEGRYRNAIAFYEEAVKEDERDELIFYNFAAALYNDGQRERAFEMLGKGLKINPEFEPILMYLANIAAHEDNDDEAVMYYEKLININRKYFAAYTGLANILADRDKLKARAVLRECLTVNPHYKPAIMLLADTYRESDPEIAEKYYELANKIK